MWPGLPSGYRQRRGHRGDLEGGRVHAVPPGVLLWSRLSPGGDLPKRNGELCDRLQRRCLRVACVVRGRGPPGPRGGDRAGGDKPPHGEHVARGITGGATGGPGGHLLRLPRRRGPGLERGEAVRVDGAGGGPLRAGHRPHPAAHARRAPPSQALRLGGGPPPGRAPARARGLPPAPAGFHRAREQPHLHGAGGGGGGGRAGHPVRAAAEHTVPDRARGERGPA
mmetsp:Transcript_39475/g.85934  ORF Transcript_39475/g.85934 Transcript_39475/m.85934 type:complete len:224 (-) Transcript_39475:43-714(-)